MKRWRSPRTAHGISLKSQISRCKAIVPQKKYGTYHPPLASQKISCRGEESPGLHLPVSRLHTDPHTLLPKWRSRTIPSATCSGRWTLAREPVEREKTKCALCYEVRDLESLFSIFHFVIADLRLAHHDAGLDRGALCGLVEDVVLALVISRSAWVRLPLSQAKLGLG